MFDLLVSGFALLFLSPLLAVMAAWLELRDGGPAFVGDSFVGRYGRPYKRWRFRTEAWARRPANDSGRAVPPRSAQLIRMLGLEQAPQLWNVFIGEMSLVGPMPLQRADLDRYGKARRYYLLSRPGMTGPWGHAPRPQAPSLRAEQDRLYLEGWSIRGDIDLLLEAIQAHFETLGPPRAG